MQDYQPVPLPDWVEYPESEMRERASAYYDNIRRRNIMLPLGIIHNRTIRIDQRDMRALLSKLLFLQLGKARAKIIPYRHKEPHILRVNISAQNLFLHHRDQNKHQTIQIRTRDRIEWA